VGIPITPHPQDKTPERCRACDLSGYEGAFLCPVSECYSTPEAARQALKEQKDA
jgi:hypothetical protein